MVSWDILGAALALDVGPEVVREVELDHEVAGPHVQALLHHIGGHQGVAGVLWGLEVSQRGLQLPPLLVNQLDVPLSDDKVRMSRIHLSPRRDCIV